MATILNSATLNSPILDSANYHKTLTQTNLIWLEPIHSHLTWWWQPSWILPYWIQPFCTKKDFTNSLSLILMMAAILNCAILDSAILVFPLKLTCTCQDWFPPFPPKNTSLTLPSPPIAQKNLQSKTLSLHSDSDSNQFNLTQTHSFSPNLMMPANLNSANLNSTILDSAILVFHLNLTHTCKDWFPPFAQKKTSLIHSDSTWWWQASWILLPWILPYWI